jgi:catechol 2,3-dioxygenase-like lactoylglutathione lyase family enzyme
MIGRLEKTVLDCPDPRALAAFYAEVLGMQVNEDSDDWVVIGDVPGARRLAFQRVTTWVPPNWPDPRHPQQLHLGVCQGSWTVPRLLIMQRLLRCGTG